MATIGDLVCHFMALVCISVMFASGYNISGAVMVAIELVSCLARYRPKFGPRMYKHKLDITSLVPIADGHCARYGHNALCTSEFHSGLIPCKMRRARLEGRMNTPQPPNNCNFQLIASVFGSPAMNAMHTRDWTELRKCIRETACSDFEHRASLAFFFQEVAIRFEEHDAAIGLLVCNDLVDKRGLGPLVAPLLGVTCERHAQISPLAYTVHKMRANSDNANEARPWLRLAMKLLERFRPHPLAVQITGCLCGRGSMLRVAYFLPELFSESITMLEDRSDEGERACISRFAALVADMAEAELDRVREPEPLDLVAHYNLAPGSETFKATEMPIRCAEADYSAHFGAILCERYIDKTQPISWSKETAEVVVTLIRALAKAQLVNVGDVCGELTSQARARVSTETEPGVLHVLRLLATD